MWTPREACREIMPTTMRSELLRVLLIFVALVAGGFLISFVATRWPGAAFALGILEVAALFAFIQSGLSGRAMDALGMRGKGWDEERLDGD